MKQYIAKFILIGLLSMQSAYAQTNETNIEDETSTTTRILDRIFSYLHINPEKLDSQKIIREIDVFKKIIVARRKNFASEYPEDFESRTWIRAKIRFLRDLDQEMSKFLTSPRSNHYTSVEKSFFQIQTKEFKAKFYQDNANQLREIIQRVGWPKMSEYGAYTDNQAFMVVLHSDVDPEFQKEVLKIFEQLNVSSRTKNETRPENFAYLEDRIAASKANPKLQKPQNYGSAGSCVAKGQWEPNPIADIKNLDIRRQSYGLESFSEYQRKASELCQ